MCLPTRTCGGLGGALVEGCVRVRARTKAKRVESAGAALARARAITMGRCKRRDGALGGAGFLSMVVAAAALLRLGILFISGGN